MGRGTFSVWAVWNDDFSTQRFALAGGFETEQEALDYSETLPPPSETIGETDAVYEVWPDD